VQRLITAQIRQSNGIQNPVDSYAGQVDYNLAPWVDWGPYLWASGETANSAGLFWCNAQGDPTCGQNHDVRYGDSNDQTNYWGDFAHPTANAAKKVADQLVIFIGKDPNHIKPGSPFVTPWIVQ
jgi:hypothetical protein